MNTKHADARADIYSLGITLWYLLTARPMYAGESPIEKLMAHQSKPIPSLMDAVLSSPVAPRQEGSAAKERTNPPRTHSGAEFPGHSANVSRSETATLARLDEVFRRMVSKTPGERYQTMTEVIAALEHCRTTDSSTPSISSGAGEDTKLKDFLSSIGTPSLGRTDPKVAPTIQAVAATSAAEPDVTIDTGKVQSDTDPETQNSLPKPLAAPHVARLAESGRSTRRVKES